ncbi:MAG: mechanosensitive ion channel [Gammaproteobacteria bacterium]|nr:mechanosensitive ion channel [Gammaproteobacteria bacterium]
MGHWQHAEFVTISWWITLAFPVADRIFNGLLRNIVKIESLQSPTFERRAHRFIDVLQTGFRVLLFGFAIFMLTRALGANTDTLMEASWLQSALKKGINLTIIVTFVYIVWELFNAIIEKKIPTEEFDAIASLEGDGGGEGASRAETLIPLIRTCVTSVLVIFLALSTLHSLGIAITPLLAGAGVVGIAIGFGAQKLVQDILSGLFFLIDDAFRRGEYIELEGLRGTVEKISLRSMQLRHHLGAVQTVPYGEIKTVSNLSRDWITMKLELRLSYETDIEAVRKIIKNVGKDMLQHEEYGKNFILPLKSQGVMCRSLDQI